MRTDLPIRAIQHNQPADDVIGVRHRQYDTPNADAGSKNRKQKRFGYAEDQRKQRFFSGGVAMRSVMMLGFASNRNHKRRVRRWALLCISRLVGGC